MKSIYALFIVVCCSFFCAANDTDLNLDDKSAKHLIRQGWECYNKKHYTKCIQYGAWCLKLYEKQALKQQASLKDFVNHQKGESNTQELNSVGTMLYLMGKSYEFTKDYKNARKAYTMLADDFYFCQCVSKDRKSWWKPAVEAKKRLYHLEFAEIENKR